MAGNKTRRTISILFAALALAAAARSQQASSSSDRGWTTGWPAEGGAVTSLTMSPTGALFAGSTTGILQSSDGGATWSVLSTDVLSPSCLAADPSDPHIVYAGRGTYAGQHDGLFKSQNGGHSFATILDDANPIAALAIDPSDPSTIQAGGKVRINRDTQRPVLMKTQDGGQHWTNEASLVDSIASLIIDPRDTQRILAGADDYSGMGYPPETGLMVSTNGGESWTPVLNRFGEGGVGAVRALAFDASAALFYAGTSGSLVLTSSDSGSTWQSHQLPFGAQVSSLAVDPSRAGTLYAGSDRGIFRSADAGAHWSPLAGLPDRDVRTLAIDGTGGTLHAGTSNGVYELALRRAAPSFPCEPGPDTLCLLGARFEARLEAEDLRTGRFTTGSAVLEADGFGYFTFPAFTGYPSYPEVVVKMVDASGTPWQSFWLFFGGLTDAWYVLTVTDTTTGEIRTYENDPGDPFCGGADSTAFHASAGVSSIQVASSPNLRASGTTLSLLSGRFRLTLSATDSRTGRTARGEAVPEADQFGYFSLPELTGDPGLPEVVVKMVDGRFLSHTFWLFSTGLTDVAYTLTLTDAVTGAIRTYESPGAFCGRADTGIPDSR